jgi:RimJ/RimL family protein N-acetyltransferase
MELRDYCQDDIWLTEFLEGDPIVMRDLGGPTPKEKIQQIHTRRLNSVIAKTVMYFTIVPDPDGGPVGTIGIWESDWEGSKIKEMGWMLLPTFQGRGLVTAAGRMILDRARTEQNRTSARSTRFQLSTTVRQTPFAVSWVFPCLEKLRLRTTDRLSSAIIGKSTSKFRN